MATTAEVVIVGGGWAGVAAALELAQHGIPFILLESAPQLGGRARSVRLGEQVVDNGQHLLIGAYHETLRLLQSIGVEESAVLKREPLSLSVYDQGQSLQLHAPPLPAPLHLAWALLGASGISRLDKWHALRMSFRLPRDGFVLDEDCSVAALLARHRQGQTLIRRFWEPLCIATLNTPLHKASARVFLRVLQDSFSHKRHDADLLIPTVPLGALFPEAASRYLEQRSDSGTLRLRQRVAALRIEAGLLRGLSCADGEIEAETVILATAPTAAARLLSPHAALKPLAGQITRLGSQPIITAYLQFPPGFRLPRHLLGMSTGLAQWLFDRRLCAQPGLVAAVISAEGEHCRWDNARLLQTLQRELQQAFPHWPLAERTWVIREKRATFECRVGIESLRPQNATKVKGLWLAGDYTATGYPATLEGAVRSGVECARRVAAERQSTDQ